MKRTPLKRKTPMRAKSGAKVAAGKASVRAARVATNPNYRGGRRTGVRDRDGERRWRAGQRRECSHPRCPRTPDVTLALHHVIYEQKVRRDGGDIWDPRNALTLCQSCHTSHHRRGTRVVPLTVLTRANLDFAFEFLGPAAFDYLRLRYYGEDPRLAEYLQRCYAP